MGGCFLCPRECGADRENGEVGFCGEGSLPRVARYSLHEWEEPIISGKRGSGTVFFSGCNLRCEFCQNRAISHGGKGEQIGIDRLCDIIRELCDMGAENINLVTPTHFADTVAAALNKVKGDLNIPVVYNSSGYEKVETLKKFEGLIDVYLPDFKYFSDSIAKKYSHTENYRETAEAAILEMFRQVGEPTYDSRGMLCRGLIVRHLVLPSCRQDSMNVLSRIAEILPKDKILVSIMSQYTPDFAIAAGCEHKELCRRLTSFEYSSVLDHASALGLIGFSQSRSSAVAKYTPDF